jgi:cyclophilin family peptidyl-prolyl cis-trans isomerase
MGMSRALRQLLLLAVLAASAPAIALPRVELATSHGTMVVELDPQRAPLSVANFLRYVDEFHYDGVIFHRVIGNFMIQSGGFNYDLSEREAAHPPVANESDNGLRNMRGTIAMARTSDPDSATAQFFINHRDNRALDPRSGRAGYTVFGRVVEGLEVVDRIAAIRTRAYGPFQDLPRATVQINRARRLAD